MGDFMRGTPKKIWIGTFIWCDHKTEKTETPYTRTDLVDELASLLKEWNNATAEEDKDWFDYESRVNAALNALEEE
jgi:hypothetical protein